VVSWTAGPMMREPKPTEPKGPTPEAPPTPRIDPAPMPPPPSSKGVSPIPIVVLGVGVAVAVTGVVVLATGPAFPAGGECVQGSGTCQFPALPKDPATWSAVQAKEKARQDEVSAQAASSDNAKTAGLVLIIAGSAVAVGGAVWLVVDLMSKKKPESSAKKSWSMTPTFGLGSAGLSGTF
jgi:hypothetical protein